MSPRIDVAVVVAGMMMMMMLSITVVQAFVVQQQSSLSSSSLDTSSTALFMGTNRRARRMQQKQQRVNKSRPKSFYEVQDDGIKTANVPTADSSSAETKKKSNLATEESGERLQSAVGGMGESVTSGASVADAATARMEARPEVSTIVVDDETGIERIQQGKAVMDVVTRKAVKLSELGPQYRLAQMFPGVPMEVRDKYRFENWSSVEVPEILDRLKDACYVELKDGTTQRGVPPHPTLTNEAIDFVLANRDLLGFRMKKLLGRLKMRAQWQNNLEEAAEYRALWKHFLTLEDSISAPFRQIMLDAEGKVGPNFGNIDLKSYCTGEAYERCGCYLVLKGMVAHWEKKVRDAEYVQSTPQTRKNFMTLMSTGDPKRYLPEPPILFRLDECAKVCLMAQKMTSEFVNTPELFDDLPPEVRFVEKALSIQGGTALRQYMIEEFCPAEGITPEALREGLRRLDQQLENMQIDPYGDLKNTVGRLCEAVAVGTDEERDPYITYLANLDPNGPGYFQTYTFNHDRSSLVRFLDNAKRIEEGTAGSMKDINKALGLEVQSLLGIQGRPKKQLRPDEIEVYEVPKKRACGRPHMLGWLDSMGDEEITGGNSSSGADGGGSQGEETFESDSWQEVEK